MRFRAWELPALPGETEADHLDRQDRQYFREQRVENADWWARVGEPLDFANRRVLDLGCGHGALSISIAESGAAEVLGLDLDARRVAFASRVVRDDYPSLAGRLTFDCKDIKDLSQAGYYDYVISKDSFEHIDGLEDIVPHIASLLKKPGGKLIAGFSPLFYSPFGDHGRLCLPLPWLHAVIPQWVLLRYVSFRKHRRVESLSELGLNKLTPAGFRAMFPVQKWRTMAIKYNRGVRRLLPMMSALRKVPGLEKYFTVSIYAVMEANAP